MYYTIGLVVVISGDYHDPTRWKVGGETIETPPDRRGSILRHMAKTPALRECERNLMPEDQFLLASVSAQTRRCYAGDWRRFEHWCASVGHKAMPASPQTVVAYLVGMARILGPDGNPAYKAPTINRHAAAIAWVHHRGGLPSPTTDPLVRKALSGIKRTLGVRPARPRPLVLADVSAILAAMRPNLWPEGVLAARDALAIL